MRYTYDSRQRPPFRITAISLRPRGEGDDLKFFKSRHLLRAGSKVSNMSLNCFLNRIFFRYLLGHFLLISSELTFVAPLKNLFWPNSWWAWAISYPRCKLQIATQTNRLNKNEQCPEKTSSPKTHHKKLWPIFSGVFGPLNHQEVNHQCPRGSAHKLDAPALRGRQARLRADVDQQGVAHPPTVV